MDICHLVEKGAHEEGDDVDVTTALCGQKLLEIDVEPFLLPKGHDYVFVPDPKNVATCDPCLAHYALMQSRVRETAT